MPSDALVQQVFGELEMIMAALGREIAQTRSSER